MSTPYWRCFHCDEMFILAAKAQEHFGKGEHHQPACQVDIAMYRDMEERVRRANDDDSDTDRAMYGMQAKHASELLREEEKGYARGMRDLRKESAPVIESLIVLALAAFHALDDSEERCGGEEGTLFILQRDGYDKVSAALDTLDALPDDRPMYSMGPASKARWALRNLLGDPENSNSLPTKEGEQS